eukprot:gnl/MRDRNA2_/MRDRNA2_75659_c0_seq1.p1 gnl/MRDRNA2_/MRDRNA2_75659_c0~~gnl/MRDRNA2_/MRDRNA2_75659_c0_seq1.p1  ORF type:complete len:826 (+),score=150.00 gnl/MRDRNA2_/MRDRNA2_75659_c0_seq1:73-2550(+)
MDFRHCAKRTSLHAFLFYLFFPSPVGAQVLRWLISNSWKDVSCDDVCRAVGRQCTEDCWPQDAADLQRAMDDHLKGVCYGVDNPSQEKSLSSRSWNPAKDPVTKVCYWDSDAKHSSMSRCGLKSETPDHLAEEGPIRRICPCAIQGGNQSRAIQCWPGGESKTLSTPTSPVASVDSAEQEERCSELCVDGFGGALSDFNGEYRRAGGGSYGPYWEHGGDAGVALLRGPDGYWRLFGANTARETYEGNFTGGAPPIASSLDSVGASDSDIPPDSTFETTQGFHQVQFRCCSESSRSSFEDWNAPITPPPSEAKDGTAGVVIGVVFAVIFFIAFSIAAFIWIRKRRRVNVMAWKDWRGAVDEEGGEAKIPGGATASPKTMRGDLESQMDVGHPSPGHPSPGILKASPQALRALDDATTDGGMDCYSWTCKICSHAHNGPGDLACLTCGRERGKEIIRKHKSVDELLASVVEKLEGGEHPPDVMKMSPQYVRRLSSQELVHQPMEGRGGWDGKLVKGPQEEWPPKKKPLQPIQVSGSRRSSQNATPMGAETPQNQTPEPVRLQEGSVSRNALRDAGRANVSPMAKANGDSSGMALAASLGWTRGSRDDLDRSRQRAELPEIGTKVVLCNLEAYPTWNGAEGEVVEVDHSRNKVCVLLEDGHERTVKASQIKPKRETLRDVQQQKKEEVEVPSHPLGGCASGECFYSMRRGWDLCYHCEGKLSHAVVKAPRSNGANRMSTPPRPTTPPGRDLKAIQDIPKRKRSKDLRGVEQPPPMPSPPKMLRNSLEDVQQKNLPDHPEAGPNGVVAQTKAQLAGSFSKLRGKLVRSR